jgi:hypothetical protein
MGCTDADKEHCLLTCKDTLRWFTGAILSLVWTYGWMMSSGNVLNDEQRQNVFGPPSLGGAAGPL